MTAQPPYEREIADALADARAALSETSDPAWSAERRQSGLRSIEAIERRLGGDVSERGFSIIRSLDAGPGVEGPVSEALLLLSRALRAAGRNDYR
tara:strand:+ start:384 stop:668 length:285 start_codon:yes stop_codon:yes gene_type:complete